MTRVRRLGSRLALSCLLTIAAIANAQQPEVKAATIYTTADRVTFVLDLASPFTVAAGSRIVVTGSRIHSSGEPFFPPGPPPSLYLRSDGPLRLTFTTGTKNLPQVSKVSRGHLVDLDLAFQGSPLGPITARIEEGAPVRAQAAPTETPAPAPTPTPTPVVPPTEIPPTVPLELSSPPSLSSETPDAAPSPLAASLTPTPRLPTPTPGLRGETPIPSPGTVGSLSGPTSTDSTPEAIGPSTSGAVSLPSEPLPAGKLAVAGGLFILLASALAVVMRRRGREKPAPPASGQLGLAQPPPPPPSKQSPAADGPLDGLKIERLIAVGGLCEIYEMKGGTGRRHLALKLLRPEYRESPKIVANLVQEASILRALNKSYPAAIFVQVQEQGWFRDGGAEHPYILMEYIEGDNLRDIVQKGGPLPEFEALEIIRVVAAALTAVHHEGLFHGDISPENILRVSPSIVTPRGGLRYRLIDFGDARKYEYGIRAEEIVGKPYFLSPEQCDGFSASPASDVYSLGMVFYFLYFGKPAFHRQNPMEILGLHRTAEVAFPEDAPTDVCETIKTIVQKNPEARPSAAQVVVLVEEIIERRASS